MSPQTPADAAVRPDAAELNAAIRRLCAGRLVWSAEGLAELARLRAQWQAAVDEERARGMCGQESAA